MSAVKKRYMIIDQWITCKEPNTPELPTLKVRILLVLRLPTTLEEDTVSSKALVSPINTMRDSNEFGKSTMKFNNRTKICQCYTMHTKAENEMCAHETQRGVKWLNRTHTHCKNFKCIRR